MKDFDFENSALVLAGGGAKGVYQIGVMKAFKKLGISFSAVTGASVGALNAALYAQKDIDAAEQMWETIKLRHIIDIPEEAEESGRLNIDSISTFHKLNKSFIRQMGFSSEPLKKLISEVINEELLRNSGVDLGIITYNISNFKPLKLFIEDMEPGSIGNYLLASASFPLFQRTKIEGKKYIDGGIYDNMPFSMVKNKGYRNITVVDVSGFGKMKDFSIENTTTTYLKNTIEYGNIKNLYRVLDFSPGFLTSYKMLGYLDTMRHFGRLEGIKYFFEKSRKHFKKLKDIYETAEYRLEARSLPFIRSSREKNFTKAIRNILPEHYNSHNKTEIALIECAASALNIPVIQEYRIQDLIHEIYEKFITISSIATSQKAREDSNFFERISASGGVEISAELNLKQTPIEYAISAHKNYNLNKPGIFSKRFFKQFPQVKGATAGILLAFRFLNKETTAKPLLT